MTIIVKYRFDDHIEMDSYQMTQSLVHSFHGSMYLQQTVRAVLSAFQINIKQVSFCF